MASLTDQLFASLAPLVAELQRLDGARTRRALRQLSWRQEEACPFCGCSSVSVGERGVSHVAYCEECDAEGPPTHTREKALELWKRRAF